MAKEELVEFDGQITELLPEGRFRVRLENERKSLESRITELRGFEQFCVGRMAEEMPVIPLYFRADSFVLPRWLKGVAPTGHQYPSTLWVETWRAARPFTLSTVLKASSKGTLVRLIVMVPLTSLTSSDVPAGGWYRAPALFRCTVMVQLSLFTYWTLTAIGVVLTPAYMLAEAVTWPSAVARTSPSTVVPAGARARSGALRPPSPRRQEST